MNTEDNSIKAKPIEIAKVAGFCGMVATLKRPPTKYRNTPAIKPDSAIKLQIHSPFAFWSAELLPSTLVKSADISGADFTEALLREDMSKKLCDGNSVRQKASGENPTTGVATRDSLFCD